jgi:hypothetical protein
MAGAIGKQRAGKGSRAQFNGTNLQNTDWNLNIEGDDLDTSHFESAGNEQGTIGFTVAKWDTKGNWNAGGNLYDTPGIFPRDDMANVKFYENVTDNVGHTLPVARVLAAQNGAQAKQFVTFGASGKSNGSYTIATGSV